MAFIPDFTVLVTAIQRVLRSQSDHLSENAPKKQENADTTRKVALHTASTVIFPRQITVTLQSSITTLLCNPAHSYPACSSCIGGSAWGTTPGCGTTPTTTPQTTLQTTPQTTVVASPPVQVTTPAPVATSAPAPAATSSPTPAQISTSSTSSSNQVVHSASQATSFCLHKRNCAFLHNSGRHYRVRWWLRAVDAPELSDHSIHRSSSADGNMRHSNVYGARAEQWGSHGSPHQLVAVTIAPNVVHLWQSPLPESNHLNSCGYSPRL